MQNIIAVKRDVIIKKNTALITVTHINVMILVAKMARWTEAIIVKTTLVQKMDVTKRRALILNIVLHMIDIQ